jgi:hypothetical protein
VNVWRIQDTEVIYCLPLDSKKNVAPVEMENADTDLTMPEGIPCTPEEIIKEIPRHGKTVSYSRPML